MKPSDISSETREGSTFFWQGGRLMGCTTKLADCVSIHVRGKFVCLPIDLWEAMTGQHEPSRT